MQLGDLELHLLIAGHWKADGGLMFGVVPKVMWEKKRPADGNNMIDMACVGLIARINGRVVVCETGIGTKLSEKRARQVALREPEGLLQSLRRVGHHAGRGGCGHHDASALGPCGRVDAAR